VRSGDVEAGMVQGWLVLFPLSLQALKWLSPATFAVSQCPAPTQGFFLARMIHYEICIATSMTLPSLQRLRPRAITKERPS
jgi:hypothetical protein